MARECIAAGKDIPVSWLFEYDNGSDRCLPAGWYATGLDARGWRMTWPSRHEYGPFDTEAGAREHARLVDIEYKERKT